jgi:trimeric autotransporter adhesin
MQFIMFAALAGCGLDPVTRMDDDTSSGGPTLVGDLEVSPGAVDFGALSLGDAAEEAVVLRNVGDNKVDIGAADLVGDAAFTLSTTSPSPWELGAGDELVLTVRFEPTEVNSYDASVDLTVDGQSSAGSVTLSGSGVLDTSGDDSGGGTTTPGALELSQSTISFGQVDIGLSDSIDITVTNTGTDDVLVSDITSTSTTVTTSGSLAPPAVLSGGSSKTMTVTFAPESEVTTSATLTLQTDTGTNPTVAVSGEGIDLCDICAPVISVDTGGSSSHTMDGFISLLGSTDKKTLTIQNEGDEDLTVSRIEVKNDVVATCGTFTLSSTAGATLVPWDTLSVDVSYTSTGNCLEVANETFDSNVIHIYSDDPSETDFIIELGALGISL